MNQVKPSGDKQIQKPQISPNQIAVFSRSANIKDLKDVIHTVFYTSIILFIFTVYITGFHFDKDQLAKADYQVGGIEGANSAYQSWYLFTNGMYSSIFLLINIIILLSLLYSQSVSQDIGLFQQWYHFHKVWIYISYVLLCVGFYFLYSLLVSGIQIAYPYYCNQFSESRIFDEQIRQDVFQCNDPSYGKIGLYKTLIYNYQLTIYIIIPLIMAIFIVKSFYFQIRWEKNIGINRPCTLFIQLWLKSQDLDRNYEYLFGFHGLTFKKLLQIQQNESVLYNILKDIGVSQYGDIAQLIGSLQQLSHFKEHLSQDDELIVNKQFSTVKKNLKKSLPFFDELCQVTQGGQLLKGQGNNYTNASELYNIKEGDQNDEEEDEQEDDGPKSKYHFLKRGPSGDIQDVSQGRKDSYTLKTNGVSQINTPNDYEKQMEFDGLVKNNEQETPSPTKIVQKQKRVSEIKKK